LWEAANMKKAVVLAHTWYPSLYCDPAMFMEIADAYPSAQIILGHSGGSIDGMVRSVEAANRCENIYLELDNVAHHYKEIEYLDRSMDTSRILFGSDFSSEDFAPHLGPILLADIEEEHKKMILGQNMKEMLTKINRYY
jgi:predicted TIM-barrel fold metal-dependent hydrolase